MKLRNNFFTKFLLLLLLIQSGLLWLQYSTVNAKTKYIQSRSNALKQENDKWLNFITNSLFFLAEKDRVRKEGLLHAISEIDFYKPSIQDGLLYAISGIDCYEPNIHNSTIEVYKFHKYINPQIMSLTQHIKQIYGCFWAPSYYVFKDFYSKQYFVGNYTYYYFRIESQNYERYNLVINGNNLRWNNKHTYTIAKSDSLNIHLTRQFLDFKSGELMTDAVQRVLKI